jgi:predicted ribosomally synthesized peptide with SipW-like signal peptide
MTKLYDTTQISRRKVLAGLGTIGVAAAGAGLGTSAFFSDREDFRENRLVAGSLDMKVDWEEHYSDWSPDEEAFARMPVGEEEADYVLPSLSSGGAIIPDARPIELVFDGETTAEKSDAKDGLWDTTSVEAYPDGFLNSGPQDGIQDEFPEDIACDILADVGDDDFGLESVLRTEGTFAGQITEAGDPLVNISDVKPGDFGEITFSFHLCDNPGYVWFNGDLVAAAENGHTEPEAEDPEEIGSPDSTDPADVELLDYVATRMWYDPNGNNQVDTVGNGDVDIMLALDASGSIGGSVGDFDDPNDSEAGNLVRGVKAFVDALPDDDSVRIGQIVFDSDVNSFAGLDTVGNYTLNYPNDPIGSTALPPALDIAAQELDANGRPDAEQIIVVFTDGSPNYNNTTYSAGTYTAPRANDWSADDSDIQYDGGGSNPETEQEETSLVAELVRDSGNRIVAVNVGDPPNPAIGGGDADGDDYPKSLGTYLQEDIASSGFYFEIDLANLANVADDLVALVAVGDEVFFQGTLREALALLSANDGRGIPLDGDTTTAFDEVNDPENAPDRDCFAGEGTTHYVAFQWWLPVNHANQAQTDSVTFDLGFYTEQCRHNDGAGMAPEDEDELTTPETATPQT